MTPSSDDVRRRAEEAGARFRARVAQVQSEVEAFQSSQERYAKLPDHEPAGDPDQAAEQLASIRAHIDHDLDVLQARVPPTDTLLAGAKVYGGVALAAAGALGAAGLSLARRRTVRAEQRELQQDAERLAGALVEVLGARLVTAEPRPGSQPEVESHEADTSGAGRWWLAALGAAAAVAAALWLRDRGGPDGAGLWGPPTEG